MSPDRDLEDFLRNYIEPMGFKPAEVLARNLVRDCCQAKRRLKRHVRVIHLKRRQN